MVSLASTSRKYRGKMASGYEAKRKKQLRWDKENEIVAEMLREGLERKNFTKQDVVLDVPVGTGRFLRLYSDVGMKNVVGVDASEEMIAIAAKKKMPARLLVGDASALTSFKDRSVGVSVCVRFLDLIDEDAMRAVVRELCRVTSKQIILTIRLGEKYVPKSNTAEHDEKKFVLLLRRLGWMQAKIVPIFNAGWHVIKLMRM